jgi:hypothetical protein
MYPADSSWFNLDAAWGALVALYGQVGSCQGGRQQKLRQAIGSLCQALILIEWHNDYSFLSASRDNLRAICQRLRQKMDCTPVGTQEELPYGLSWTERRGGSESRPAPSPSRRRKLFSSLFKFLREFKKIGY